MSPEPFHNNDAPPPPPPPPPPPLRRAVAWVHPVAPFNVPWGVPPPVPLVRQVAGILPPPFDDPDGDVEMLPAAG